MKANKGKWTRKENEIFEKEIEEHILHKKRIRDIAKEIPTRSEKQIERRIAKMKKKYIRKLDIVNNRELFTKLSNDSFTRGNIEYKEYEDKFNKESIKIDKEVESDMKLFDKGDGRIIMNNKLLKFIVLNNYYKNKYIDIINEDIYKNTIPTV